MRWLLLLCLPLWGCTFHHTVDSTRSVLTDLQMLDGAEVYGGRDWVVPRTSHWLVVPPEASPEPAADLRLTKSLAAALRQEFADVSLAAEPVSLTSALKLARQQGAAILVVPSLLYHGDGAYSWAEWRADEQAQAFGRDRLGVQLRVYDALSGRMVDTVRVLAKESWLPALADNKLELFDRGFQTFAMNHAYQQRELPR